MHIAKLFENKDDQAGLLPKPFRMQYSWLEVYHAIQPDFALTFAQSVLH